MACTTILVGKDASYDGSTIIARNEDSANGEFNPKRFIVVKPEEQPREYKSVISHLTITLPDDPLQYTAVPNADLKEGIWGEAGVNEANVAMSATETLTTNERVLGADPFVEYTPAKGDEPEVPGGIGEEDFLTIVLPYVKTAREGVQRLGALLEEFGTYEMNGVAFSDSNDLSSVCQKAADENDALYVPTDNTVAANTGIVDGICRPAKKPVFAGEEGICAGCGVATLSISYYDLGYATGEMAAKILAEGADISTMPVEFAPNVTKKYNAANCEALGITPPDDYVAIG